MLITIGYILLVVPTCGGWDVSTVVICPLNEFVLNGNVDVFLDLAENVNLKKWDNDINLGGSQHGKSREI